MGSLACAIGLAVLAPAVAEATALPDGRVYEQVSPVNKNGNSAGASIDGGVKYSFAAADGESLLYGTSGPMGSTTYGAQVQAVATRTAHGWESRAPLPRPQVVDFSASVVWSMFPSDDLSKIAFTNHANFSAVPTASGFRDGLFLSTLAAPATVLNEATDASAVRAPKDGFLSTQVVGGAPDLSTIYFSSPSTLVAGEEARAAHVPGSTGGPGTGATGLYEYRDGALSAAGVLPDGTLPEYGAAPAGAPEPGHNSDAHWAADSFRNQVSRDGSRLFFVSPDPMSASEAPRELYARIDGQRTVLISRSDLTDGPAPTGASKIEGAIPGIGQANNLYAYPSADGAHVFFQSVDRLTADAPADDSIKSYVFDVGHETQRYLPGVTGIPLGAADDGSQLLFLANGTMKSWSAVTGNVRDTPIAISPVGAAFDVAQVRATADAAVYVFSTNGKVAGFANPGGYYQVYRYDRTAGSVACLSCGAAAGGPTSQASLGLSGSIGTILGLGEWSTNQPRGGRELSADGQRVFFDTEDGLLPQDTNGRRDVYEWSDGHLSLISTGKSLQASYYLDASASGNDVFIATAESLNSQDTDEGYDVYDARVGGGFTTASAVSCTSTCQGGLGAAPFVAPVASVTFAGAGNMASGGDPPVPDTAHVSLSAKRVRGSQATVNVKVTAAGRISLRGSRVHTVRRTVTRPGTYTLKAGLTKTAVRTLRIKKHLVLKLKVGYEPVEGASVSKSVTVTAKKA